MSQHESRNMIWRFITPPTPPAFVGPRTSHWPKHIAPENPRAYMFKPQLGHLVIDPGFTVFIAVHLPPNASVKKPIHKLGAVDPKRIFKILIGSGAKAVNRKPETLNSEFRHEIAPLVLSEITAVREPRSCSRLI